MSFKDSLLLKDWCHCIPYLILCTVTLGLVLCPQPPYLRNDGFARDEVLRKDRMEGQRWENIFILVYFNGMRCYLLASHCSKLQPRLSYGVNWSCLGAEPEAYRLADLPLLGSFLFCLPTYPPTWVLTCTFILIHITSDTFYKNRNHFFFSKEIQCSSIKNCNTK